MDIHFHTRKNMIKKAATFNGVNKASKKVKNPNKSSSPNKKTQNIKRESVLKPSIYQKIQNKRNSKLYHTSKTPKTQKLSKSNPSTPTTNTNTSPPDNRRIVFISLRDFYECWRTIPANTLFDAILILPLYRHWIIPQTQLILPKNTQYTPHLSRFADILCDSKFITLLQWKDKQGLLFYLLSSNNTQKTLENVLNQQNNPSCNVIAPFWCDLSDKLESLYDPNTCDRYCALLLNERWWKYAYTNMYGSKFNVSVYEVLNELHFLTMKFKCMQEILYQSNPTLNVLVRYESSKCAVQCIKSILRFNTDCIQSDYNCNYNYNYVQSPSNDSSSHVINVNSGSEEEEEEDINLNYEKSSCGEDCEEESVSLVGLNVGNKSVESISISESGGNFSFNSDMEWWLCPQYYYDTIRKKIDTDGDTDY